MYSGAVIPTIDSGLGETIREADEIYEGCFSHSAIATLGSFNRHLASRVLTAPELRLFFSSMAAFNRHTIGGIAILAGRLSDVILPYLPKTGHEIGAYVLARPSTNMGCEKASRTWSSGETSPNISALPPKKSSREKMRLVLP